MPRQGDSLLALFLPILFILLTSALSQALAASAIDPADVPLVLGWSGVIACILAVVGVVLTLINPNISMVSFAPYILYEIVLGFWLLLRGGQISPP